jgi:hypothetical protein
MDKQTPHNFSRLLESVAASLDIPDTLYEDAVVQYEDVGEWLGAPGSALEAYSPKIYPQGSFRLGTVVRPTNEDDDYDIDLVCQLDIEKERTTQKGLKALVGDRLKERADLKEMLSESRRAWNLDYEGSFHMDVLPSLPNREHPPSGILLTDKDLTRWQMSNPIAYAEWFRERMKVALELRKAILAESMKASVEDVPDWQVRTPLQRAVQILKRHRDICFANDQENRPVSIIITTLAARAYGNESDIYEALSSILDGMPRFIGFENGRYVVRNPVEPGENFADKWNEYPTRRVAFLRWIERVRRDLGSAIAGKTLNESAVILSSAVGAGTVRKAVASLGVGTSVTLAASQRVETAVPGLGSTAHCQRPSWPERLVCKAALRGEVYRTDKRGNKLWDLANRPVPKHLWLKFMLSTNARLPYEVRWQVVNTGREAEALHGLRGGFSDPEYKNTHWESTLYVGTHWIEAFIIKDGTCVARTGRKMVMVR